MTAPSAPAMNLVTGTASRYLLLAVNIALGSAPIDQCPLLDSNGDDTATVNEILAAVDDTLAGCPAR